jgi:hypothetical protein
MDVTCAKCDEPWDSYHMRHDAIWETDLPEFIKKNWDGKLTPEIKAAFERDGWRFVGNSVYAIRQCPACKNEPDTVESRGRAVTRAALAEILGDDQDGLISELNDLEEMGM